MTTYIIGTHEKILSTETYTYGDSTWGDRLTAYNASGTKLVTYKYDAWGNHTAAYTNGGSSTGAYYNPFRYRGYYYDTEFGLYYLNSRYYDSNTGRFLNTDSFSYLGANQDLVSYNLFLYCSNNPITYTDNIVNYSSNPFYTNKKKLVFCLLFCVGSWITTFLIGLVI